MCVCVHVHIWTVCSFSCGNRNAHNSKTMSAMPMLTSAMDDCVSVSVYTYFVPVTPSQDNQPRGNSFNGVHIATGPSSYRNGMGRGGSAQSQGGAGTASILLLPYHLHHRAAAVCLCTQRDPIMCAAFLTFLCSQ